MWKVRNKHKIRQETKVCKNKATKMKHLEYCPPESMSYNPLRRSSIFTVKRKVVESKCQYLRKRSQMNTNSDKSIAAVQP